ncbi:MAG: hypothetical protein J6X92_07655 [Bacteroidales bacterium]|nr:hypothetical protein [Bacteroidales bacterium]
MKRIFILFVCLLFGCTLFAQDIITKKDGTDIQAKVIEVGPSQISYKTYSNINGPTYTMNLSDILMITYENGFREMYNVNNETKSSLPQGVMTYNSWSGKVSVGGITLENEMLERYFTPENYNLYKKGKRTSTIGGIVGCIGACPFGWSVGTWLGGGEVNAGLFIGGGTVMIGGLIVSAIGEKNMKKAINSYNSTLASKPVLNFGATPNGIGLALVF